MWFKNVFKKNISQQNGEITLKDVSLGEPVSITCLQGETGVCQRLREMGFCESAVVKKVADSGALICQVANTKVVISKRLANNIIVRRLDSKEIIENKNNFILLSQMSIGQRGVIRDFVCESDDCERIEEMGITPGEAVEIIRYAPLGDPIEIKIRGYLLSLRKEEADLIEVTLAS